MASLAFDCFFAISLPLVLTFLALAQLVALISPLTLIPSLVLANRLYWAVPVAAHVWKGRGVLRGTLLRMGFEATLCMNVVRRFLTLPLRPYTPEVFVLGWPQCGTADLAALLKQHPAMSGVDYSLPWHPALAAESHFFNGVLGRHAASSLLLYRSFFPTVVTRWWRERIRRCGRWMCFDACPLAACLPYTAKRIAAVNPSAKLVFMVRDPVEAAFATELMLRNTGMPLDWSLMEDVVAADPRFAETPDDARFWAELAGLAVGEPLPLDLPRRLYSRCSTVLRCAKYAECAGPFLDLFPRENIMFIEHSEFMAQPEEAVAEVLRFVGADPGLSSYRYKALPPPPAARDTHGRRMHPAVRRKLQHYFVGPNQRLFALLGREFPWGEAPGADEEEGGGGGEAADAAAAVLCRSLPPAKGRAAVDRVKAAELMPQTSMARKESGLVKRVISVSAKV